MNVLLWLLAIELIGLAAFPIAFALTSPLRDRGYSVAKPLGLVLLSWPLWLLGSFNLLPSNAFVLWGALALMAVVSGRIAYVRRAEMAAMLRRERHAILIAEAVFLLMFLAWVFFRSYDAAINSTEQPMDFAFLNAAVLADFFPPEDPWLRGGDVPYYYFGYLMMGNLTEMTLIPTRISYNLALALIPAMAASAAFGLVYNLIRAHGAYARRSVGFGLVAPVLLLVASNLVGLLEFVRLRGFGSAGFWSWIGIKDLGAVEVLSWRPMDYLWWWRSSRVIDTLSAEGNSLDYTITEFPYFSFLLGDLHPHAMSIPFVLLFVSFSLAVYLSPARKAAGLLRDRPWTIIVGAVLLGALAFVNVWDIVTFGVLWAVVVILRSVRWTNGDWGRALPLAWQPIAATLFLAVLLYAPYYLSLDSQASGILPAGEVGTRPIHFLILWGLFLSILTPFLLRQLYAVLPLRLGDTAGGAEEPSEAASEDEPPAGSLSQPAFSTVFWPRAAAALAVVMLPFFVWAAWQLGWNTVVGSSNPFVVVGERLVSVLPLAALLFVTIYTLIRAGEAGAHPAMVFVLTMVSLGLLLILGPEFLRLDDLFHNRMNTIFKLYYQAWILLATASAFGLYFLSSIGLPGRGVLRAAMAGWWVVIGLLLAGSLYYPVEAAFTKSGQFQGEATLDGLAHVARSSPGEYAAIRWLQDYGEEGEGVLEAVGNSWSSYSRVSSSTGLPTVLGWPWHEHQWRGSRAPFEGREEDVRAIYETRDASEAARLLDEYGIKYVVVGPRERDSYGTQGLPKFSELGDEAFSQDDVTIYRIRE